MKKVFCVKIRLKNGSFDEYNVVAKDDTEAREKVEKIEMNYFSSGSYPGTDFCEINLVRVLNGE